MIPESKYIENEITVRKMRVSGDVLLTRKSMVRWLALSLGLISPNESRQMMIDLLDVLLTFHFKGEEPTSSEIIGALKKKKKELGEKNEKAVRYHLTQLVKKGILVSNNRKYSFARGDYPNDSLAPAMERMFADRMDESFKNIRKIVETIEKTEK